MFLWSIIRKKSKQIFYFLLFDGIDRFSSGDLSSECDDVDPIDTTAASSSPTTSGAHAVLQQQPLPHSSSGGPPNIPPPPAPNTNVPPGDLSLSLGKTPLRGTSAPTSPAKSRESLLQRVQSLTGAARDQGASIIGLYFSMIASYPICRKKEINYERKRVAKQMHQ